MIDILKCLDQIEQKIVDNSILYKIDLYLSQDTTFIPIFFVESNELIIYTIFNQYNLNTLKILCKIICNNKNTNKYNFYKFFLTNIISLIDSELIYKYVEIFNYCVNSNFFTTNIINKFIYYYPTDNIWNIVKHHIPNYHYIYKGMTVLNLSFSNIPLFDFLLSDAIDNKLYDPFGNKYTYYSNNHMLTRNLDYEISIYMSKSSTFRNYILSKLPIKYKFLKNYRKLQNIIVKNNILALEEYFQKYDKYITANSRLNCNQPLIDYVDSIEMFYYIVKRGANINSLTIEPTIFSEIRYDEFYFTNTFYNNPLFVLNNLEHYYKAGLDFSVNKLVIRKIIKIHHKLFIFHDETNLYLYNKMLSFTNKYIRKTKNKVKTLLRDKFYKDIITKINEYV